MRRTIFSLVLVLCLLLGSILPVFAENGSDVAAQSEDPTLPQLKVSEECIAFIKENEGFAAKPFWDYSQYSVGYGSRCEKDDYPNGITKEEADALLRSNLVNYEAMVDKVLEKGTVEHTQAQYDAIVSLTYNLGPQWMNSGYNIYRYILFGGYTEMEFVNTMGSWCSAGGEVLAGLCKRRMEEADLYLHGDYQLNNAPYRCIEFKGDPGKADVKVQYYSAGARLSWLPDAVLERHHLTGWYIIAGSGRQTISTDTLAPESFYTRAYAIWAEGDSENGGGVTDFPFQDVSATVWYYPWIKSAVEQGLFSGVSEVSFNPDGFMTRGMLVTVLHRAAEVSAQAMDLPYTDVAEDQWYTPAVQWAYHTGIANGISETEFAPDQLITREQLATMLYRFALYQEKDTGLRDTLRDFRDAKQVSPYALEALQWAVAAGIINGSSGEILPQDYATRAECAKMLVAYLN